MAEADNRLECLKLAAVVLDQCPRTDDPLARASKLVTIAGYLYGFMIRGQPDDKLAPAFPPLVSVQIAPLGQA